MTIQRLTVGFLAVALLAGCGTQTRVIGRGAPTKTSVVAPAAKSQQILIKFKAQMAATEFTTFRATYGLRNVSRLAAIGVYVEEVTSKTPVSELLATLNASPLVEWAELNQEVSLTP